MPFEKYVTFQPKSSCDSKNYDRWSDVLSILLPILEKDNIKIIQFGEKDNINYNKVYNISGQTLWTQVGFLIKNSILHFGADSFGMHLAGNYNKPCVGLYSNNYISCTHPFFGDKSKQIFLEPDRKGNKPSFSYQESPKTINTIPPELIVKSVCQLLDLPFNYKYKTLYFGEFYHNKIIEGVPDQIIEIKQFGVDNLIMRMDFKFDENILFQQLNVTNCSIVTNKPVNLDLLKSQKQKIRELIYIIDENHDINFIKKVQKLGIKYIMISFKPQDWITNLKLDYCDLGIIFKKQIKQFNEISELKNLNIDNLYYKSSKFTLSQGKIYPSFSAWKKNLPISSFECPELPIIYEEDFVKELEHFYVLA